MHVQPGCSAELRVAAAALCGSPATSPSPHPTPTDEQTKPNPTPNVHAYDCPLIVFSLVVLIDCASAAALPRVSLERPAVYNPCPLAYPTSD